MHGTSIHGYRFLSRFRHGYRAIPVPRLTAAVSSLSDRTFYETLLLRVDVGIRNPASFVELDGFERRMLRARSFEFRSPAKSSESDPNPNARRVPSKELYFLFASFRPFVPVARSRVRFDSIPFFPLFRRLRGKENKRRFRSPRVVKKFNFTEENFRLSGRRDEIGRNEVSIAPLVSRLDGNEHDFAVNRKRLKGAIDRT